MKHVELIIDYLTDGTDFQYFDNTGTIVRCKDCEYWDNTWTEDSTGFCGNVDGRTTPDFFCADGERKESDNE